MNNIEKNNLEIIIVNLICMNIFRLVEMSFFIYISNILLHSSTYMPRQYV